jgi:deoxycytidine triphosphate deaminase
MFLTDKQIADALRSGDISVQILDERGDCFPISVPSNSDLHKSNFIQASSIDLTIGSIYVPPENPRNAIDTAHVQFQSGLELGPGQTAVVETRELIRLGKGFGAFGFPPAGVSRNSILMTNPGHVDPGYSGHLSFTLINMGRKPFRLYRGERIASLLLFKLTEEVLFGYSERNSPTRPKWAKLLDQLSPDFASFASRMRIAAREAVDEKSIHFERVIMDGKNSLSRSQLVLPLLSALVAGFLGYMSTAAGFVKASDFNGLATRVQTMEIQSKSANLEKSLEDLTAKVELLQQEIRRNQPR